MWAQAAHAAATWAATACTCTCAMTTTAAVGRVCSEISNPFRNFSKHRTHQLEVVAEQLLPPVLKQPRVLLAEVAGRPQLQQGLSRRLAALRSSMNCSTFNSTNVKSKSMPCYALGGREGTRAGCAAHCASAEPWPSPQPTRSPGSAPNRPTQTEHPEHRTLTPRTRASPVFCDPDTNQQNAQLEVTSPPCAPSWRCGCPCP